MNFKSVLNLTQAVKRSSVYEEELKKDRQFVWAAINGKKYPTDNAWDRLRR